MKNISAIAFILITMLASVAYAQLFGAVSEAKPHHTNAEVSCMDCHGTDDPLDGAEEATCLDCHGSRDDIAALTKGMEPNPHFGHEDGISCKACHREHEESVLYCDDCHNWEYTTP